MGYLNLSLGRMALLIATACVPSKMIRTPGSPFGMAPSAATRSLSPKRRRASSRVSFCILPSFTPSWNFSASVASLSWVVA